MDHTNIALPRLQIYNKMIYGFGQLPIICMGMIHGYEDEKYAQYLNDLWPNDHNWLLVATFANFGGSFNIKIEIIV